MEHKDNNNSPQAEGKSGRPSKAKSELIGTATIEPAPQLPANLVPSDALDCADRHVIDGQP